MCAAEKRERKRVGERRNVHEVSPSECDRTEEQETDQLEYQTRQRELQHGETSSISPCHRKTKQKAQSTYIFPHLRHTLHRRHPTTTALQQERDDIGPDEKLDDQVGFVEVLFIPQVRGETRDKDVILCEESTGGEKEELYRT